MTSRKDTGFHLSRHQRSSSDAETHRLWHLTRSERGPSSLKICLAHGALRPVNLPVEGVPHCVCPVRTADKNDGSARFVHNSRKVNRTIPRDKVKCELESLMKTRNIHIPGGYAICSDFTSGYHCLGMFPEHQKYVAFALHSAIRAPKARVRMAPQSLPRFVHA